MVLVLVGCAHAPPPVQPDRDPDHDTIVGAADLCPNDPEDFDGFQDADGCPDLDNDHDGIPDAVDKCPNDPETYNGWEDEDGCPDHECVVVRGTADCFLDLIWFHERSATIDVVYAPILDGVARSMVALPDLELVAIGGHHTTTELATLGTTRALAVVNALVTRGVAASRLVAVVRDADRPVPNPAPRVDFEIRKQRVDPASADDVACTPVGRLGISLTPEQKLARCREQLHR